MGDWLDGPDALERFESLGPELTRGPTTHTCKPCKCGIFDQAHCKHSHDPWFGAEKVVLIDDVEVDEERL